MELQVLVRKLQNWEERLEEQRRELEQEEWNSLQQVPEAKERLLDPEELEEIADQFRQQRTKVLPRFQRAYERSKQRLEGQLGLLYAGFLNDFQEELQSCLLPNCGSHSAKIYGATPSNEFTYADQAGPRIFTTTRCYIFWSGSLVSD